MFSMQNIIWMQTDEGLPKKQIYCGDERIKVAILISFFRRNENISHTLIVGPADILI